VPTSISVGDPVSWLLIQKGWKVLVADGLEVGRVVEVTGDKRGDIFDGLAFRSHGRHRQTRYVGAAHVESITQGRVTLDLGIADVQDLDDLGDVFTQSTSLAQRLRRWLRAPRL
jgi:hypothetical protein